jgi:hypothetical protein
LNLFGLLSVKQAALLDGGLLDALPLGEDGRPLPK